MKNKRPMPEERKRIRDEKLKAKAEKAKKVKQKK